MSGMQPEAVKAAFQSVDPNVKVAINPSYMGESVE